MLFLFRFRNLKFLLLICTRILTLVIILLVEFGSLRKRVFLLHNLLSFISLLLFPSLTLFLWIKILLINVILRFVLIIILILDLIFFQCTSLSFLIIVIIIFVLIFFWKLILKLVSYFIIEIKRSLWINWLIIIIRLINFFLPNGFCFKDKKCCK